jgi:hypothetical protein
LEAAWYRARRALRRRWPATLALMLLVGLAGGVVLTAVAGARRASTAYDRFRAETLASDLDIAFDGPPAEGLDARAAEVARLPQVAALTRTAFPFVVPADSGQYPYLDFLAVAGLDEHFTKDIDRLRTVAGRLPDPERADEIAVLRSYADEAGIAVGDRVAFDSFLPEQLESLFGGGGGPPAGPRLSFVVAGVFDMPVAVSESSGSFLPKAMLTRAFLAAHGDRVAIYPGGFTVRLHNGARDVPAVSDAVRAMFAGEPGLELTPATEVDGKVDESIRVVVWALLLFAFIAALAACVAIAQALGRHLAQDASSNTELATLGMTRGERVATLAATAIPIAVGGSVAAVVVAVLASPLMPIGVARRAEPDLGISLDGVVLVAGAVLVTLLVMLFAIAVAMPLARDRKAARSGRRRATVSRIFRRGTFGPPTEIGVGYAIEPRAGTAWPVRSAIVGVAFGATGIAATIVFVASLATLSGSPNRYGAPWDALVSGFTGDVGDDAVADLVADDTSDRVGRLATGIARVDDEEINVHSLVALKGQAPLTVLDGRLPERTGEAALGVETLRSAGVDIGDDVTIAGAEGSVRVTVVGRVALPIIDERSSVGRGALVADEQLIEIITADERSDDLLVAWSSGVDRSSANNALGQQLDAEVFEPRMPSEVKNLRAVRALPWALAIFLAVLAILATAHALMQTTRMRRHELAVLRTLGFQRRQLSSTIASQATTIALLGVVLGVPIGALAGVLLWRSIAERVGVVDGPAVPAIALAALALAIMVVANLAAIIPGRRAARVSPSTLLREGAG